MTAATYTVRGYRADATDESGNLFRIGVPSLDRANDVAYEMVEDMRAEGRRCVVSIWDELDENGSREVWRAYVIGR
jgi:hypothetical protein